MKKHYKSDTHKKSRTSDSVIKEGLILIPDISGYSKYVESTDIVEGNNLIYSLLSSIIKNNRLGLSISEIEGDAVLFYKYGNPPAIKKVLKQFEVMLQEFNAILKQITNSTVNLSLKMIAHYGPITELTIGRFKKLYGETVTIAHRLLKNSVDSNCYALLTDDLIKKVYPLSNESFGGVVTRTLYDVQDNLKEIGYTYFDYEHRLDKQVAFA